MFVCFLKKQKERTFLFLFKNLLFVLDNIFRGAEKENPDESEFQFASKSSNLWKLEGSFRTWVLPIPQSFPTMENPAFIPALSPAYLARIW